MLFLSELSSRTPWRQETQECSEVRFGESQNICRSCTSGLSTGNSRVVLGTKHNIALWSSGISESGNWSLSLRSTPSHAGRRRTAGHYYLHRDDRREFHDHGEFRDRPHGADWVRGGRLGG